MLIAIIGAGNVGTALATSFVRAGHDVVIASRDPEDAASAAAASGAPMALNFVNEGAWQSGWKLVGAPLTAPVAA